MNLAIQLVGTADYQQPVKFPDGLDAVITALFARTDEAHPTPHAGTDFAFASGAPVPCVAPGSVVFVSAWRDDCTVGSWEWWFGNSVIVDHGDGTRALYAHFAELLVAVGDAVSVGQPLGVQGTTGHSTGEHLHLAMSTDANPYFNKDADGGCSRLLDPLAHLVTAQPVPVPDAYSLVQHNAQRLLDEAVVLHNMAEQGVPAFVLIDEAKKAEAIAASIADGLKGL